MNSNITNFTFPAQNQTQFDNNENYNNIDSNSTLIPVTRTLITTADSKGGLKTKQANISFLDNDLAKSLSDLIKNYNKLNPHDSNNIKNNCRIFEGPSNIGNEIVNHASNIEQQINSNDIMSYILNNLNETHLNKINKIINNNNNVINKFTQNNNPFNNNRYNNNNIKKFGNIFPQQQQLDMNMMMQNPIYGYNNNRMMFNQNNMQQQQMPPYNNLLTNPLLMQSPQHQLLGNNNIFQHNMQQQYPQQYPNYNNYLKQNLFGPTNMQPNIFNSMYNHPNQFQQQQYPLFMQNNNIKPAIFDPYNQYSGYPYNMYKNGSLILG